MCSQNFLLLCVLVLKVIIFNVFRIRSRIQKRTKVHHLHLGVQQGQKSQPPYETTFLVREPRLQKYVKKVRIIANQSTFWTNLSDFLWLLKISKFDVVWLHFSQNSVGLQKILQLLTSEDQDVQIHAVKVVANLAAEGAFYLPVIYILVDRCQTLSFFPYLIVIALFSFDVFWPVSWPLFFI